MVQAGIANDAPRQAVAAGQVQAATVDVGAGDTPLDSPSQNWEGQAPKASSELGGAKPETRRGNSTENEPKRSFAPPRRKSGQWIEFKPGTKRKDGSRLYYPRWRRWRAGNEKKEWIGPVADLDPMTEKEKNDYVKRQRAAKKRRQQRGKRGQSSD